MRIQLTVLAHNEEGQITACLESMLPRPEDCNITVVVNGSTDGTARIVRGFEGRGVELVEYAQGGKARSWNRFVLDECRRADLYVFADGDARFVPGTLDAFAACAMQHTAANAIAGLPCNGRRARYYRTMLQDGGGLFGDCYALCGSFVERMRSSGIRLPDDIVGEDGLIAALALTDLRKDGDANAARIVACDDAGFLCTPTPLSPTGLRNQSRRMVNYAVRHFQNRIVSDVMEREGATGLPRRLSERYGQWLPRFRPRRHPVWYGFDRAALRRMAAAERASG